MLRNLSRFISVAVGDHFAKANLSYFVCKVNRISITFCYCFYCPTKMEQENRPVILSVHQPFASSSSVLTASAALFFAFSHSPEICLTDLTYSESLLCTISLRVVAKSFLSYSRPYSYFVCKDNHLFRLPLDPQVALFIKIVSTVYCFEN